MGAVPALDPRKLDTAGWGLVFPSGMDPGQTGAIREALQPLIDLRRKQVSTYQDGFFQEYIGSRGVRPDETAGQWLARHGQGIGPADPLHLPYYLLLAAPPDQISYEFQTQLDFRYGVGRIWFETQEEWAAYAESVVRAEQDAVCPRRLAFFHPTHPADAYTGAVAERVAALTARLSEPDRLPGWEVQAVAGADATRAALAELLGKNPPGLVYLAGHALVCLPGDKDQRALQGGLVCAEWPGPDEPDKALSEAMCFTAGDVPDGSNLCGRVVVIQASFSLGTPGADSLRLPGSPPALAEASFAARLPQRLLSLAGGRGALGVFGWNERVWGYSGSAQAAQENYALESVLARLGEGEPAGYALDLLSVRYTELVADLDALLQEHKYGGRVDPQELVGREMGQSNARGAAFFGDPAVRLRVEEPTRAETKAEQGGVIVIGDHATITITPQPPVTLPVNALVLEVRVSSGAKAGQYRVETSLVEPDGSQISQEGLMTLEIDRPLDSYDPDDLGMMLREALFSAPQNEMVYARAQAAGRQANLPVRVRLCLEAPELHGLPWEALYDSAAGGFLFQTGLGTLTRSTALKSWLPTKPAFVDQPRALVMASQPSNLDAYRLTRGDLAAELSLARSALAGYALDAEDYRPGAATLQSLEDRLRQGCEVLYLVCHAALRRGDSSVGVLFEKPDGRAEIVRADTLVLFFSQIDPVRRPRLVVLVPAAPLSVQPLTTLAPALLDAGIPAVLTFRADLDAAWRRAFLASLFKDLRSGERLEMAFAAARSGPNEYRESWKACLYAAQPNLPLWNSDRSLAAQPPAGPPELLPTELSLRLSRADLNTYHLELSLATPDGQEKLAAFSKVTFDFTALRTSSRNPQEYGALLSGSLFAEDKVKRVLAGLQASLEVQPARLRLAIDPSANELHDLAWECLLDPERAAPLAMNECLGFARFLSSSSWRRSSRRQEGPARILLAIAAPSDLERYSLSALDVQAEIAAAQAGLSGWEIDVLASGGDRPVTPEAFFERIQRGPATLVWLISHAVPGRGEVALMLEDEQGQARLVPAAEFSERFLKLHNSPSLVVLAGASTTAIGLYLASAGIRNVLVNNNGPVSLETHRRFMAVFFQELARDGQADRAAAVARLSVRDRPDWWVPVLMTRVRSGQV